MARKHRDDITPEMDVSLWDELIAALPRLARRVVNDAALCKRVEGWHAHFVASVPKGATGLVGVRGASANYAAVVDLLRKHGFHYIAGALSTAVYWAIHGKPGLREARVDAGTLAAAREALADMEAQEATA
jgi:hypothetical protein